METPGIKSLFSQVFVLADAPGVILPVAIYVVAMAVYAIIIFKFYRFIAGRDIFSLDLSRNDTSGVPVLRDLLSLIGYVIKFILLFPAFAFLWFAALTVMLAFLSEDRALSTILILALATVSAIRVCAYYDEDLSRDLAKILPFAVLAIILIDSASLDIRASVNILQEVNEQWHTVFYYWLFLIALEVVLRIIYGIFRAFVPADKRQEPARAVTDATAATPTTSDD
ncbi:MAG: hypothetical protein OXL37_03470 [Chloroflexota bacterium]|nr:hypothetical protein [Chloroflexota bacterium]MDE2961383.1 hypothetical protein [Chloroflexota bacterium]